MAAPRPRRARPRRGSLDRPVNARTYRGTWLLVGLPLLVAAFTVGRAEPLPPPQLPPLFDGETAAALAEDLSFESPDRRPGTPGSLRAAGWVRERLELYGFEVHEQSFHETIPGLGRRRLTNLYAVAPGVAPDAPAVVVMAHRDDAGVARGANDNASGTAALIELARPYARLPGGAVAGVTPTHTLVFLSSDGGAFGGVGAERFAEASPYRDRITAVLNLDTLAGPEPARLELAGDLPRSPPATLVETAAERVLEQTGAEAERPSALRQLVDLALPFSLHEHAPFVARGTPALTLTTAGDRPGLVDDPAGELDAERLGEVGSAAQQLLASLDQGLELPTSTASYVWLGPRFVRGWTIQAVLVAALLPFLWATVDFLARCRRQGIALAPALRSLRSRLGFWLYVGLLFAFTVVVGAWPRGAPRPPAPHVAEAADWPVLALAFVAVAAATGWVVARERLLPRRGVTDGEELGGYAAAFVALAVVALAVAAVNPFALLFVLPSLHAWLWLPQLRQRHPALRFGVLAAGFAGPALLVGTLAHRLGLGLDTLWYMAALVSLRYVDVALVAALLAWLAVAGQLGALAAHRYAAYPAPHERPARGPLREAVRRSALALGARRRGSPQATRAAKEE